MSLTAAWIHKGTISTGKEWRAAYRHDVGVPSIVFKAHLLERHRDLLAVRRRQGVELDGVMAGLQLPHRPSACRRLIHLFTGGGFADKVRIQNIRIATKHVSLDIDRPNN